MLIHALRQREKPGGRDEHPKIEITPNGKSKERNRKQLKIEDTEREKQIETLMSFTFTSIAYIF